MPQDPQYLEIRASLRGSKLYVKAPVWEVLTLCYLLEQAGLDLGKKEKLLFNPDPREQHKNPVVLVDDVQEWQEDLKVLLGMEGTTIARWAVAITQGLANNPTMDWISDVDGSKPHPTHLPEAVIVPEDV